MSDQHVGTGAAGSGPVRLFLVDDQELVRAGFRMVLDAQPDMTVVGEAADGLAGVEGVAATRPDVVLMDIRMPRMDGVEATRRITEAHAPDGGRAARRSAETVAVLVLTTFDHDDVLYGALRAGASGYLLKHSAPANLLDAVRTVADGGSWIDPSVAGKVIATLRAMSPTDDRGRPSLEYLSPREVEVLRLMADAPTNAELAEILFVSEATVKTHISRLLMKTGSHDRAQLVALAYRSGLVRP